jgi:hypothetical protein
MVAEMFSLGRGGLGVAATAERVGGGGVEGVSVLITYHFIAGPVP